MAVDAPRTHLFLNFSGIAAPSSRIAAFYIVVVCGQGSGYILVVAANIRTVGVVRGFSWAAF
ncbi:hypothetical protein [Photobacterium sanguinicancri]|uniref:hypothetical protein n=1 Tax=Photobacterium sanguinicancri TaxID=875932 RepID=UPI003D11663A